MQDDNPHFNATAKDYDLRLLTQLIRPSSLSGLACLIISLLTVCGVVVALNFQGSGFRQDLLGYQQQQAEEAERKAQEAQLDPFADVSLTGDYGQINDNFANSNVVRNIPVMVFWMFVGTLVYFIVTGITGALGDAKAIGDELNYVHVRRKELLHEVYVKSAIRLATLVFWLLYIVVFFRIILPYVLAAAQIAAGDVMAPQAWPYLLLSFVILTLSLHLHIVMLRLTLLRPRVFAQETSF